MRRTARILATACAAALPFAAHPAITPERASRPQVPVVALWTGRPVAADFTAWSQADWLAADADAVALALDAGADPRARNRRDVPPIGLAAAYAEPGAVSALLAAGADANALWRGRPALALALRNARDGRGVAAALLAAGADPDATDADTGRPVIALAAERHLGVFDAIVQSRAGPEGYRGADVARLVDARYLDDDAVPKRTRILRHYLRRAADPAAADPGGRTLLHAAARFGVVADDVLEAAAAGGAALGARDAEGRSALAYALAAGHWTTARKLLALGATPEAGDWRLRSRPGDGPEQAALLRALYAAGVDPGDLRAGRRASLAEVFAAEDGRGAPEFRYLRDLVARDPVLAPALFGAADRPAPQALDGAVTPASLGR